MDGEFVCTTELKIVIFLSITNPGFVELPYIFAVPAVSFRYENDSLQCFSKISEQEFQRKTSWEYIEIYFDF